MNTLFFIGIFALGIFSQNVHTFDLKVTCETADELIPHEDCTKYYQCSNFEPILSECPGELYFNPEIGSCDFPYNVPECVGGTRDPETGTTLPPATSGPTTAEPIETTTEFYPITDKSTTEEPVITTSEPVITTTEPIITTDSGDDGTTTEGVTTDPSLCPPEGIVNVGYPGNCSLYYLCVNGNANLMQCAEGLLFDEELGKCNLEEEVDCKYDTTAPPTSPTTDSSVVECPVEGIVFLPDPTDCKKYYLCVDGEAVPQECADGLLFDPVLGKCNTASEVECNIAPECPAEGIVYLPLPNTCTKYIMCISGEAIPMDCANGTEFDPVEGKCVLDSEYECPYTASNFWLLWRK